MDQRVIRIFDTTLRDGEQAPGCSMDLREKLEVANQLERLRVDTIEAGFPSSSPGDFESVRTIAESVKEPEIVGLARLVESDIRTAWDAIKCAAHPVPHIFIATSPIHMQYKLRMTEREVLERVRECVTLAKSLCGGELEFSAEDATRSDRSFLIEVLRTAVECGATRVNVPDTVGYTTPTEMFRLIKDVSDALSLGDLRRPLISVHCHNDLGLAVANSLAAVAAGAEQIECTVNGLGERAGNASLEETVMALCVRSDFYNCRTNIDTRQIFATSRLLSSITGMPPAPNKPIVGANAFAHEAGIHQHGVLAERTTYEIISPDDIGVPKTLMVLGKHSGRHAFSTRLSELGIYLEKEAEDEAFERFKIVADRKKEVSDADIAALASSKHRAITPIFSLDRFIVNSGNTIPATAVVRVSFGDELLEEASMGDGPIDAAFNAISILVGRAGFETGYELDDYQIRSVTEGHDALGEVVIKLKKDNRIVMGRGLSTDIIESSIQAYLNGINKVIE